MKNQKPETERVVIPNLQVELEREMMAIKNDLENGIKMHDFNVIDEFLNDAIDLALHIEANTKYVMGFDIGITIGGPFITLEYTRARCELVGAWGNASLTMEVNNEVCEEIMERLTELNNGN